MWYPYEKKLAVDSPRLARPPSRRTPSEIGLRTSTANADGKEPFFVDDDRKSKITIVSLKSNRTSRTVQTMPSVIEQPPKPKPTGAKAALKSVKDGFRSASIKRIIGSGLSIATALLLTFGVFLPFWNVYTTTSLFDATTTGYYGGLWGYCLLVTGSTADCYTFEEATIERKLSQIVFGNWLGVLKFKQFMKQVVFNNDFVSLHEPAPRL